MGYRIAKGVCRTTDEDGIIKVTFPVSFANTSCYTTIPIHDGGTPVTFNEFGQRSSSVVYFKCQNMNKSAGANWIVRTITIGV